MASSSHAGLLELPVPAARASSVVRLVVWSAVYAIPAVTALQPIAEFDTWWHLRTGQWIVEHGTVPSADPFTGFGLGKPWVAYSWLFGLLLYGLNLALGLRGIVLYRVVLAIAVVAGIHRLVGRRGAGFALTAALVAVAAVALTPLLVSERPGLFTVLFVALTLDGVLGLREGTATRAVWLLPVCYALWANLHIQFIHGLFVLGLACAAPLADRLLGRAGRTAHAATWGSPDWRRLVILAVACFVATLLNPYGFYLYSVVLEYGRQTETYSLFPELRAMDFREVSDWVVLGLTGAAAYALGRRARLSVFDLLLAAAALYFSFHTKHDLWFVVLTSAAAVAGTWGTPGARAEGPALAWPQRALAGIAVLLVVALVARQRDLSENRLQAEVAGDFPVHAVSVIEQRGYTGPLYHNIDWGGYVIWRLPQLPAAIDGRTNLHGDQRIKQFADTWEGQPGWDADPDLAAARLVLLQPRAPLAGLLRQDPGFAVVYEDAVAVVFVRRDPAGGA
jgi:hypothetical protein